MPLSVAKQDKRIRQLYPDFRLVLDAGFMGAWEGPLTPVSRTYRIRITYLAYNVFDGFTLGNPIESVVVLDPPIGRDPRGTGERAQHVYYWDRHPDFPRLCLYDPAAGDWNWGMFIAETLIPFTIDWLLWHEDWVATGIWRGKGRHPEPPDPPPFSASLSETPAHGEATNRQCDVLFHRFAELTGSAGAYWWIFGNAPLRFRPVSCPDTAKAGMVLGPRTITAPVRGADRYG